MKLYIILVVILVLACTRERSTEVRDENIDSLIRSENVNKVIYGFYLIGEKKDTAYVKEIFKNIYDSRVSHNSRFLGISVYQSKVIALRKISGLDPPNPVTYRPDPVVISFYIEWAKERGYFPQSGAEVSSAPWLKNDIFLKYKASAIRSL